MLDFLLGRRDPSRDWTQDVPLELTFALDRAELNGAGLGDPAEAFSFLGPSEDRKQAIRGGGFFYYSLGLCIAAEAGPVIDWLEIVYDDEYEEFQPYRGRITYQDYAIELQGMTIDEFIDRFGPCYWRDDDEDETILFYEFPQREWQIEFALNGILKRVQVTSQPLMAQASQRESYGVTEPWPPAYDR